MCLHSMWYITAFIIISFISRNIFETQKMFLATVKNYIDLEKCIKQTLNNCDNKTLNNLQSYAQTHWRQEILVWKDNL